MQSANTSPAETAETFEARLERLEELLAGLGPLAVAFSGGVDSSVLLHAGLRALGANCVAVIADSPSLPREELRQAVELAEAVQAELIVVHTDEMTDERYVANAGDRCYFCKSALFERMSAWARDRGFAHLAFGEITDDLLDDRPGAKAASEFGVRAPLREAGFDKLDVRRYAREANLNVADKPASACLASRIPRGVPVTRERLATVEAAEALVRERGVRVLRVRHHGSRALLEVGEPEFESVRDRVAEFEALLAPLGFEELVLGVYRAPAER